MFPLFVIVFLAAVAQNSQTAAQMLQNSRLNYFDTDLLRYAAEDRKGNVLLSPASIKSVLAMLLEGAAGPTAFEIRSVLRLSPYKADFREQLNKYLMALAANGSTQLENANGVFVSDGTQILKSYQDMLNSVYLTEVHAVDFKSSGVSANIINEWVSQRTKGLIPTVIEPDQLNPETDILLINALYFKSKWRYMFRPELTRSSCFYNNGVCNKVAMMELHAELNYAFVDNLRAHAVELPYEDGRFSMFLLIPQERNGHTILVRDLPYMNLAQITQLMSVNEVNLYLPKFTVDYDQDMVDVLRNMKVTTLFSPAANLSGIFKGHSSQISNMFHRIHLEVNEEGTVAAASTGAAVVPLINSAVQLVVDRPFIFLIRDNQLGFVLFEGRIEEPSSYSEQSNLVNSPQEKSRNQPGLMTFKRG